MNTKKTNCLKRIVSLVFLICLMSIISTRPTKADIETTTVYVTKTEDTNGSCTVTDCSLREAIAAVSPGGTIIFNSSTMGSNSITLGSTLLVDKDLTIDGSDFYPLYIGIHGDDTYDVFYIVTGVTAYFERLAIRDGSDVSGGGIHHEGDFLQIKDCWIRDNTSILFGGAIYNNSELEIIDSNLYENTTLAYGGAIHNTENGVLTITDTKFHTNSAAEDGGAIYNQGGTVTISGGNFYGNSTTSVTSGDGGAVANNGGSLTISGTKFEWNSAAFSGGAIYNESGSLTISDSNFYSNTALNADGGAIYNLEGTVNISQGSEFLDNTTALDSSGNGGAVANEGGSLTISNARFDSNTADFFGGAIYNEVGTLSITDSMVWMNSGVNGGAIYIANMSDMASISGSTFAHNFADGLGGAIYISTLFSSKINNSTFFDNYAGTGAGVYNAYNLTINNCTLADNHVTSSNVGVEVHNTSFGTLYLRNSILANSGTGWDCVNLGTVHDTNNLIEANDPNNRCGIPLITADPMLGPMGEHGGPTETRDLLPGSPAINAGDDATCEDTDQRGVHRPVGSHCDIGSVEKAYFIYLPLIMR